MKMTGETKLWHIPTLSSLQGGLPLRWDISAPAAIRDWSVRDVIHAIVESRTGLT
jgi:hypothetical protein